MLEFNYENVDVNNSYFYVYNSRLYYKFYALNNSLSESIQATFDVQNINTQYYSIAFSCLKHQVYCSSINYVVFTDVSLYYESDVFLKSVSSILPQDKVLTAFTIIVDDNENDFNGYDYGYISDISLIYYPDIDTTITILSLTDVLPLLVLLVVVPLVLYFSSGKRYQVLIISLLFMSIFALANGLMPLWLAFMVWFGLVSYYLLHKRME